MGKNSNQKENPMNTNPIHDLVDEYRVAAHDLANSKVGSIKGKQADARIERLVEQAQAAGILREFLAAI